MCCSPLDGAVCFFWPKIGHKIVQFRIKIDGLDVPYVLQVFNTNNKSLLQILLLSISFKSFVTLLQ